MRFESIGERFQRHFENVDGWIPDAGVIGILLLSRQPRVAVTP